MGWSILFIKIYIKEQKFAPDTLIKMLDHINYYLYIFFISILFINIYEKKLNYLTIISFFFVYNSTWVLWLILNR